MIAFWLMPAAGEREFFRSVVTRLGDEYDAPVFEPHVTLAAGEFDEERALAALEQMRARSRRGFFTTKLAKSTKVAVSAFLNLRVRPIRLQVHSIGFSGAFTKTVFVQLHPSGPASDLSVAIARAVGDRGGYQFDPHLSLIYKSLPDAEKETIAGAVHVPFAEVSCDAVRIITGPAHTSSSADVEAWRTLAERPLG